MGTWYVEERAAVGYGAVTGEVSFRVVRALQLERRFSCGTDG